MKLLSTSPPNSFLHEGKKWIKESELLEDKLKDHLNKNHEDFSKELFHFIRNDLNNWKGVPHYIEDNNGYLVFEYFENLIPISFSKLLTDKRLKESFTSLLETLHHQIIRSRFYVNEKTYYIMPSDIWIENYMYDPKTYEIRMIDIDSFHVEDETIVDDIFKLYHNGQYYNFKRKQ